MYESTKFETLKTVRRGPGVWAVLWERYEIGGVRKGDSGYVGYTGNILFPDTCKNLPADTTLQNAAERVYASYRRKK